MQTNKTIFNVLSDVINVIGEREHSRITFLELILNYKIEDLIINLQQKDRSSYLLQARFFCAQINRSFMKQANDRIINGYSEIGANADDKLDDILFMLHNAYFRKTKCNIKSAALVIRFLLREVNDLIKHNTDLMYKYAGASIEYTSMQKLQYAIDMFDKYIHERNAFFTDTDESILAKTILRNKLKDPAFVESIYQV